MVSMTRIGISNDLVREREREREREITMLHVFMFLNVRYFFHWCEWFALVILGVFFTSILFQHWLFYIDPIPCSDEATPDLVYDRTRVSRNVSIMDDIRKLLPDVKIIVVLRNPTDR